MKSYFDAKPFHQKLCLNLSNDIQEAILKNAIKFYINAKKENLFFFSNKQILIIQEGATSVNNHPKILSQSSH